MALVAVTVDAELSTDAKGFTVGRYVVTTSTGYRAELTACRNGEVMHGACMLPAGHRKAELWEGYSCNGHSLYHCQGWHLDGACYLAEQVLATYGTSGRRMAARRPAVGVRRGAIPERFYAPLWTPREELPLAA